MIFPCCVIQLQIVLCETVVINIKNRIKQATCFALLSHNQAITTNIKKTLNTAVGARSPLFHIVVYCKYSYNQNLFQKCF